MARGKRQREPDFQDGTQPVSDLPPDEPGPGRAALLLLVAFLALCALAMPVAWGLGRLASVAAVFGPAVLTIMWIVWGLVLVAFLWLGWELWRRGA